MKNNSIEFKAIKGQKAKTILKTTIQKNAVRLTQEWIQQKKSNTDKESYSDHMTGNICQIIMNENDNCFINPFEIKDVFWVYVKEVLKQNNIELS